jgi:hypothetical protein
MPPLPPSEHLYPDRHRGVFASSTAGWLLQWTFLIGIVLGLGRLLVIGTLALAQWLRSRRREREHAGEQYEPFVSIIVPAFNEEFVIEATIRSLLNSITAILRLSSLMTARRIGPAKLCANVLPMNRWCVCSLKRMPVSRRR